MKKFFSISIAFLILLTGTHLSVATHFCAGKVAAVKWSFSGENATCGMTDYQQTCPANKNIDSNCCKNEIANYSVDNNYTPSIYQNKEVTKDLLQVLYAPVSLSLHSFTTENFLYTNVSPPDPLMTSAVSLADICIFRI
jgi:hypothetical protein